MTVDALFGNAVESLSPSERLRLATQLLETLSPSVVDDSEEWPEVTRIGRLRPGDWDEVETRLALLLRQSGARAFQDSADHLPS